MIVSLGLSALLIIGLSCDRTTAVPVIRKTEAGKVRGFTTDLAQVFKGIRYAAPAERWTPPTDPESHRGVENVFNPGPMCYQPPCTDNSTLSTCTQQMSEDCLFLNIFAPLETKPNKPGGKKTVMIFIHGGSFVRGTGAAPLYNGENLAKEGDVIVVTFNYRLGVFSSMVSVGGGGNDVLIGGNYGIMDQEQALKWIYNNIEEFGGDKEWITLVGQSSGAMSVFIHLTSTISSNYFNNAILISTPHAIPLKPLDIAIDDTNYITLALNCSIGDITCLRNKSPAELITAQIAVVKAIGEFKRVFPDSGLRQYFPLLPYIDGTHVTTELNTAALAKVNKPLIFQSMKDEGCFFIYPISPTPIGQETYAGILGLTIREPTLIVPIIDLYENSSSGDDKRENLVQITTDYIFQCSNRFLAKTERNTSATYLSRFDEPLSFDFYSAQECNGRASHTSDVPFLFKSARTEPQQFTQAEQVLSDELICYFSNFAKSNDPNQPKECEGPFWPIVDGDNDNTMYFKLTNTTVNSGVRGVFCDFWDENTNYRS